MALGLLYRRQRAVVEERLFNGWTFFGGVVIYVLGLYSYATSWSYTVTDACIGTGLSIILAHIALWSGLLPPLERMLAYVGAFSYGLYLLHQPYVIYFGERMRTLSLPAFVVLACAVIAALALGASPLERYVNQLTGRVLDRKKESRPPVKAGARQPAA
jgi:peptidoglycan/LPS O-acetylase OafA/YrhL